MICSQAAAGLVERQRRLLSRLGFDLVQNGPESVAVHRVPALLRNGQPEAAVLSLLSALEQQGQSVSDDVEPVTLVPLLALHAGQATGGNSLEELDLLLRQFEQEDVLNAEPPVWTQLTERDLEGLFASSSRQRRSMGERSTESR